MGSANPTATAYFFARGTDFRVAGAICAVVVAGGALGVYSGVRERPEFATRERYSLTESIKSVMRNRPFVILLISTTLAVMAIQVPTVLLRFLAKYWVHDGNAAARWPIAYFAGGVV
jgi:Na+/melibiose symporter-like transporter